MPKPPSRAAFASDKTRQYGAVWAADCQFPPTEFAPRIKQARARRFDGIPHTSGLILCPRALVVFYCQRLLCAREADIDIVVNDNCPSSLIPDNVTIDFQHRAILQTPRAAIVTRHINDFSSTISGSYIKRATPTLFPERQDMSRNSENFFV